MAQYRNARGSVHRHLRRLSRGRRPARLPPVPRVEVPRRLRRLGGDASSARTATSCSPTPTATGTAPGGCASSRPTASSPRSCTPTPSRRSSARGVAGRHRAVGRRLRAPARRPARAQPLARRLVRRVPRRGAPASARSCSTTSTKRCATCTGSPTTACAAGVLLPGVPPDAPIPPLHARVYDPVWRGVRGARRHRERARRQQLARLRRAPGVAVAVDHGDGVVLAPPAVDVHPGRRLRPVPGAAPRARGAGERLDPRRARRDGQLLRADLAAATSA